MNWFVRNRLGLSCVFKFECGDPPGTWEVNAGVNPKNLKKAIGLIEQELQRFVKSGVTKEELADSQANYVGRLPLSVESNGGVASGL